MKWTFSKPTFEFLENLPAYTSGWSRHFLFGFDLVKNIKPKVIVELGSHRGHSTFSFAQSVKDNKIETTIYAIDSWEGDKHAGAYSNDVFDSFNNVSKKYYNEIPIIPYKMYFDEAVDSFEDNSIDVLHIDGLHTYEAVKNDFESWFPKVKQKTGIILLHDISEKRSDFGVYKLWNKLKTKYSVIEFKHSHGLGVIFLDKKLNPVTSGNKAAFLRHYYVKSLKIFFNNLIFTVLKSIKRKNG